MAYAEAAVERAVDRASARFQCPGRLLAHARHLRFDAREYLAAPIPHGRTESDDDRKLQYGVLLARLLHPAERHLGARRPDRCLHFLFLLGRRQDGRHPERLIHSSRV